MAKNEEYIGLKLNNELNDLVSKYALANKIGKSEAVRRLITDSLFETSKQEEKVVKRFEEFEKNVDAKIEKEFASIKSILLKNTMYELTNHHLIKIMIRDLIHKGLSEDEQRSGSLEYLSVAKIQTLTHPVDSINSKSRFDENIKPEHLKKVE